MLRLIVSSVLLLSGCAWWQAGVSDPAVVADTIASANAYRELGEATGIPYAKWAAGGLAVVFGILLGGRKKLKKGKK
jgi:hypothetical protein